MTVGLGWSSLNGSGPELYEQHMVPAIFDPWADELIALARPGRGEHVLDLACGTGVMCRRTYEAVQPRGRVTGLDVSPAMLQVARARLDPAIELHEGSAIELPFADGSFDLLLCQQGLQYFPDRTTALSEARRVLRPGGRIALAVFCASPGHLALANSVRERLGSEAAALSIEPFVLADAAELLSLVENVGFQHIHLERREKVVRFEIADAFIAYMASTRAGALTMLTPDDQKVTLEEARAALHPFVESGGLALPMESHLVVAIH